MLCPLVSSGGVVVSIFIRVAGPRGRLAALQVRRTVFVEEQGLARSAVFDEHDAESLLLLASQADVPVACARLRIEVDDDDLERAEVQWLAVLPEHRGQGIGSALLSAVESEALRRGLDAVHCQAPESLHAALARAGYADKAGGGQVKTLW